MKCESTSEFCEVFFKQGKINKIQVNSCSDYCAAYGLKCLHSYQIYEFTTCMMSQFMNEYPGTNPDHPNSRYRYTTCDVPNDVTNGIGCVCGKLTIRRLEQIKIEWLKFYTVKKLDNMI